MDQYKKWLALNVLNEDRIVSIKYHKIRPNTDRTDQLSPIESGSQSAYTSREAVCDSAGLC